MGIRIGVLVWLIQASSLMLVAGQGHATAERDNVWNMSMSSTRNRVRVAPNEPNDGAENPKQDVPKIAQRYHIVGSESDGERVAAWKNKNFKKPRPPVGSTNARHHRRRRQPPPNKNEDDHDDGLFWRERSGVSTTRIRQTSHPSPAPRVDYLTADFSSATTQNPIVLFQVLPSHSSVEVDIRLPANAQETEIYMVKGQNVEPESSCDMEEGSLISTSGSTAMMVFLDDGIDTIVVLCAQNIVIGQSYFIFKSAKDVPKTAGREWYANTVS